MTGLQKNEKRYFSQMNLNSIFLEAIENIIYDIQLAQEIILNIKHQYIKHDEGIYYGLKNFFYFKNPLIKIEDIINDIIYKKILETYVTI